MIEAKKCHLFSQVVCNVLFCIVLSPFMDSSIHSSIELTLNIFSMPTTCCIE